MNKKNIVKLIIIGILALVFILLVINSRHLIKNTQEIRKKTLNAPELTLIKEGSGSQQGVLPQSQGRSQIGKFTYKKLEEKSINLIPTRDPFSNLPANTQDRSPSDILSLSGILWDKDKPMAIIDGGIVKKGARVGNKTVVDIQRDRVILSDGQIVTEIKLKQ